METFSVLLRTAVTPELVAEFVKANGGRLIDDQSGYGSIERGGAAVYVGLELPVHRDRDALAPLPDEIRKHVEAVLLITVSRRSGSKHLAFEISTRAEQQWEGLICWDGLTEWESEYQRWLQLVESGRVDALPQID